MSDRPVLQTPGSARTGGVGQAYLLFAVCLLLLVTVGSVAQLVAVLPGLAFTELVLILAPAVAFVRWKRLPVASALGWRAVPATTALLSVLVGMTAWGVAAGLLLLTIPLLGEPPTTADLLPRSLPHLAAVLLCAALLPGICEEALFRGAIQGVLRRRGAGRAIVAPALLFAVFHVNPLILVPAFVLGIVFGVLAERTGSTLPAMLAHTSSNSVAFVVAYAYRDRPDDTPYLLMTLLAASFLVLFPAVWIHTRGSERRVPELARAPAALPRPLAWIAAVAGGCAVLLAAALFALSLMLVSVQTMPTDAFDPDVRRGESIVILKSGLLELELEPGDIVSVRRDGRPAFGRIASIDDDTFDVAFDDGETEIRRERIDGKIVHVIRP